MCDFGYVDELMGHADEEDLSYRYRIVTAECFLNRVVPKIETTKMIFWVD